jgi:hypothetical protein
VLLAVLAAMAAQSSSASALGLPTVTSPIDATVAAVTAQVDATTEAVAGGRAPAAAGGPSLAPEKSPSGLASVSGHTLPVPANAPTVAGSSGEGHGNLPTISAQAPHAGLAPSGSVEVSPAAGPASASGGATPALSKAATVASAQATGDIESSAASHAGSEEGVPSSASSAMPTADYGSAPPGYGGIPSAGAGGIWARVARRESRLKSTVVRLAGCLEALPVGQRELLALRSGLRTGAALDPGATAARLHLSAARLVRRERRAVRELQASASAGGCAQAHGLAGVAVSAVDRLFAEPEGITGGPSTDGGVIVEASYAQPATRTGSGSGPASRPRGGLLGAAIPAAASDAILVALLLLAAFVTIVVVLGDEAGLGPRHGDWRRRIGNRLRARR